MKNNEVHFLDTNILISLVLPYDSKHQDVRNYFKIDSSKFISKNVNDEFNEVLNNVKRLAYKILAFIQNNLHITETTDIFNIKNEFNHIKYKFKKQYGNQTKPEGFLKKRFDSQVNNLFEVIFEILSNYIIKNNLNEKNVIKDFDSIFKRFLGKAHEYLNELNFIYFNDPKIYKNLRNIGVDKADAEILIDSYGIYKQFKKDYYFVTNDNKIHLLSLMIKKIFKNHFEIVNAKFENQYTI